MQEKKQIPNVLRELTVEAAIRKAAKLHQDKELLVAVMPETFSLRSTEFLVQDKCYNVYTKIFPANRKRARVKESLVETFDASNDGDKGVGSGREEQEPDDRYNKKNTAEVQRDADTDTVVPEKKENAVVSEEAEETVDINDEEVGKRLK